MTVTVPKIGIGIEEDPIRPDTPATRWVVLEERETEFVIDVLEE